MKRFLEYVFVRAVEGLGCIPLSRVAASCVGWGF